jgi:flagellar basal-body rod protein FlgG
MRDLYIALSGAIALEKNLTVVANNLANVNTAGFKQDRAVFQSFLPKIVPSAIEASVAPEVDLPPPPSDPFGDKVFARMAMTYVDFSQGQLRETLNPLDLSIEGPGFFVIATDEGERYTRAGSFHLSPQGELITAQGWPVQGAGGAIQLNSANAAVAEDGTIVVDGQQSGRVRVVQFDDQRVLDKVGGNLFALAAPEAQPRNTDADDQVRVRQNVLEYSNVNPVEELVRLIKIERSYEMTEKAIAMIDQAYQSTIQGMLR